MIKIEFGFGIEQNRKGEPIPPEVAADALHRIGTRALDVFGGFTLYQTDGGWRDPKTRVVYREAGRTLMVLVDSWDEKTAVQFADFIKRALDQEGIAVTTTDVDFRVI